MKKFFNLYTFLLISLVVTISFFVFISKNQDQKRIVDSPKTTSVAKDLVEKQTPEYKEVVIYKTKTDEIVQNPILNKNFTEKFSIDKILEETGSLSKSSDPNWWLNSGAYFYVKNGVGTTIFGDLPEDNKWRVNYAKNNSGETDKGYHPQNIFRLVLKSKWHSYRQQAYYKIKTYHLSSDSNRQASNGFFLFNRYQDGNNLYYTGLRVDGTASIKKKYKGTYYEMASKVFIPGVYNRVTAPNLLPIQQWIGIRSEISDLPEGEVQIKFFVDLNNSGVWQLAAEAVDDGKSYGGRAILQPGYAGIRTDFMDVEFDNYQILEQ